MSGAVLIKVNISGGVHCVLVGEVGEWEEKGRSVACAEIAKFATVTSDQDDNYLASENLFKSVEVPKLTQALCDQLVHVDKCAQQSMIGLLNGPG